MRQFKPNKMMLEEIKANGQRAFARKYNVNEGSLSRMLSGKRKWSQEAFTSICEVAYENGVSIYDMWRMPSQVNICSSCYKEAKEMYGYVRNLCSGCYCSYSDDIAMEARAVYGTEGI